MKGPRGRIGMAVLAACAIALASTACGSDGGSGEATELTVVSFNIYGGGANGGATGISDTAAAIEAAGADIVGVQETRQEGTPCTARFCDPAGPRTPGGDPGDRFDHHDRIDFVLAEGDGLEVTDASIVGESAATSEIVSKPWPSDHRASVATVTF